ncbi:MAG: DNA repair protein RecO [Deltaproteobacteria bacterium]|nr:DNA repair protein RecO [Deltaproteobacteria bacterium]
MRSPCVTPAIVLRSWPFGESDKIVSFLTEGYGKVTGIAKGAKRSRRRFVNTLEPFSLVNLRFQDRPHGTLAFVHACDTIRHFKELTTSLEKIAYASYFVEITDGLAGEREENRRVFQHLREGLIFLEENGISLSFLTFFELKLLKFSGVLCGPCSTLRKEAVPLSSEALGVLAELQEANSILPHHLALSPAILKESRPALVRFIQFQINKELKSAPFLEAFSCA